MHVQTHLRSRTHLTLYSENPGLKPDNRRQSEKPVVLIVDEIDVAANNQVFLDFLAQLRAAYLDSELTPTFQSVILAGVYDIRNIRHKLLTKPNISAASIGRTPITYAISFPVNNRSRTTEPGIVI